MPYGTIKVDNITFTNGGSDTTITVSGLALSTTGNLTVTGTVSGAAGRFGTLTAISGIFSTGSAAAPSISFSGDSDSGIYSSAANEVAITTSGSIRVLVDSNGNLAVGNNAQNDVGYGGFTVNGNNGSIITLRAGGSNSGRIYTTGTDNLNIDGNGSASTNIIFRTGTSSTERMRLTSAGLLGLGTNSPATVLHINQPGDNNGITWSHASRTGIWKIHHSGVSSENLAFIQNNGTTDAVSYLMGRDLHTWSTGNTERARIDSSGRFLVGTSTAGLARASIQGVTGNSTYTVEGLTVAVGGNTVNPNGRGVVADFGAGGAGDPANTYGATINLGASSIGQWGLRIIPGASFAISDYYPGGAYVGAANPPTERLRINAAGNVIIGNTVSGATAAPPNLDLGLSFSNGTTRDKCKIYLYNSGTDQYGFGLGPSADMQYHSNGTHDFYIANSRIASIGANGINANLSNFKMLWAGYVFPLSTITYYLIATLPASNAGSGEGVYIEVVSLTSNTAGKSKLKVALGQRAGFWYAKSYEGGGSKFHIRVFQPSPGGVANVYFYNTVGSYDAATVTYYNYGWGSISGEGATLYDNPSPTTTTPTGTLIFDSANESSYPINDIIYNAGVIINTPSPRKDVTIGSLTPTITSTPGAIDLGGTYSNTAGANLKLMLYNDGTIVHGLGVSAASTDYVTISGGNHVFYRGSTEIMRTDGSSRLLIGKSSGAAFGTTGLELARDVDGGGWNVYSTSTALSSAGGNIACNQATANAWIVKAHSGGIETGGVRLSGTTGTAFPTSSDYRLKENIVSLDNAVDRLKQLSVYRFNFIAEPDRTVDGFIAHEVAPFVPEAVYGEKDAVDEDGSIQPQGLDQSKLVPLLTAALQEAITKIEILEQRLVNAGIA